MPNSIVAFSSRPSQRQPVPRRARPSAIRALPAFEPAVVWLYACVLGLEVPEVAGVAAHGQPADSGVVVNHRDVHPALRDRFEEEVIRSAASLDPIAESAARHRARQIAVEHISRLAGSSTVDELADPDYLDARARAIADAIIDRYRQQLVYGPSSVPPQVAS